MPTPATVTQPTGGREPSPAQAGEQPRRAGDAERLARDVADEDAQGDGGGVGAGEEGAAERDAGVGEREQRDDDVAGPGMVELLEPLVRGQRRGEPGARRLRQVGGRLLAEAAEQVAGPFQVGPGRRVGDGQQPHHQADDHRVDAGLQDRDPRRDPRRRVDDPGPDPGPAQEQDHGEDPGRDAQRDQHDGLAVGGADHHQRDQVIDDRDRQQERAHPVGEPGPGQRQRPERERRVRRHGRAPAVSGRAAGVDGQVDDDGDDQPAQAGRDGQRQPGPLAQFAHVELAAGLQAEDEEEERHQPAVDPLAQVQRHPGIDEPDRQPGAPDGLIRRRADVHPDQRGHRHAQQHCRAAGLRAQEHPQRRLQIPRPRRPPGKRVHRRRRPLLRHGILPRGGRTQPAQRRPAATDRTRG